MMVFLLTTFIVCFLLPLSLCFFPSFFILILWTVFVTKVCEGLRPRLNDCPESIRPLVISCWDGTPTNRPCLFFSFLFSSSSIITTTNHFFKHTAMMNSVFGHCEDPPGTVSFLMNMNHPIFLCATTSFLEQANPIILLFLLNIFEMDDSIA